MLRYVTTVDYSMMCVNAKYPWSSPEMSKSGRLRRCFRRIYVDLKSESHGRFLIQIHYGTYGLQCGRILIH
jgi:hypothetical protein